MKLLDRLKTATLPCSLDTPSDIEEARDLERLGYIEARFVPKSKGRETYGEERGAVVLRVRYAVITAP